METKPLIVFVPGLRPKPEPAAHTAELLRCLLEGVRRIDPSAAGDLAQHRDCFELIAWNHPFYKVHHDIELDRPGIEAVLLQYAATIRDKAEARSWKRRIVRAVHRIVDRIPVLIPPLANEKTELHLNDLYRYVRNRNGVADAARRLLQAPLQSAMRDGRPTLLIGHSMGSVIAYDALWQLSHQSEEPCRLDTLLTLGSPLGQRLVQRRLLGSDCRGAARYPDNIGQWINIAAVGDMTTIDARIAGDFSEMSSLGLVEKFEDRSTYNYFRDGGSDGELNVHSEYGYLVNDVTAAAIAEWWCGKRRPGKR